jgi:hypothetical protein
MNRRDKTKQVKQGTGQAITIWRDKITPLKQNLNYRKHNKTAPVTHFIT